MSDKSMVFYFFSFAFYSINLHFLFPHHFQTKKVSGRASKSQL
jgi:hypothetical protein